MNISKYCEFLLEKKHSDKKNTDYYCVTLRIKDFDFPIIFLNEKKYNEIKNALD